MNTGTNLIPPLISPRRIMEIIIDEKEEIIPIAKNEKLLKSFGWIDTLENLIGRFAPAVPPIFEAKLLTIIKS